MSHRCRPASRLVAQMLVASAALACALPAAAADAPFDPLALPVDEPAAVGVAAPTRVSLEAAAGYATRRDAQGGQADRGIARLALDARHAQGLGEAGGGALRGVVSARIDASDPEDPRVAGAVFSLRKAFVGWQADPPRPARAPARLEPDGAPQLQRPQLDRLGRTALAHGRPRPRAATAAQRRPRPLRGRQRTAGHRGVAGLHALFLTDPTLARILDTGILITPLPVYAKPPYTQR
jgi:hypothetical protein